LRTVIGEIGNVLGLFQSKPADWLSARQADKARHLEINPDEVELLIAERRTARSNKDFKRSDEIRDYLLARNIQLIDTPKGTTWTVK
jgi:cysteinyl-tRNA synthetase